MDKLRTVAEILNNHHFNAAIKDERCIVWKDSSGMKHSIDAENIDIDGGKAAWFQLNLNNSAEFFVIFENDTFFQFPPKTMHPGYDCDVYLVEWNDDFLIIIYHEKHNVVISSIKDKKINTFEFHGEAMVRRENILYFQHYGLNDSVRRIRIPEMKELESITLKEAIEIDVVPKTLVYFNNLKSKRLP